MPTLSRWFIKAGLVSLALALMLELLELRPTTIWPALPGVAVHLGAIHLLTVGWLLQIIVGVAFWMFPRHPTAPPRGDPRYGWTAFALINLGLLLRLAGETWRLGFQGPRWPLVVSAVLQLVGVGAAVILIWPRVRAAGK